MVPRRHRVVAVALAAATCASTLAGCSSTAPTSPDSGPSSQSERDYPEAPRLDAMVDCMDDAGWEVVVDWQGGFTGPEMSAESASQWVEASNKCAEEVKFFDTTLSPEQLNELYDQEVSEFECLSGEGYAVTPPPSRQSYLDQYQTADQYYAIADVLAQHLPDPTMRALTQKCTPPTWFLNVSGL